MGFDWELNTLTMVGEAVEHFGMEDNLDWMDAHIVTVSDLIFLNGESTCSGREIVSRTD